MTDTITLHPEAVRRAWREGRDAADELDRARDGSATAAGDPAGLGPLAGCLEGAARELDGALRVAGAVVDEHSTGLTACLDDFAATDGASAGRFHGLTDGSSR